MGGLVHNNLLHILWISRKQEIESYKHIVNDDEKIEILIILTWSLQTVYMNRNITLQPVRMYNCYVLILNLRKWKC
jgi:hypothetical protein